MGLGWDKERTAGAIGTGAPDVDLDASAVQFSGDQLFDLAFYNNLSTRDGSVVHLGDNQTGSGEGDDEQITVDLSKIYPRSTPSCSSSAATRATRSSGSTVPTSASSTWPATRNVSSPGSP